jgi:hypothetical protein
MTGQGRSPHADDDGVRVVRTSGGRRLYWVIAGAVAFPVVVTLVAVAVIRASSRPESSTGARPREVTRAEPPALEPHPTASPSHPPARVTARRVVAAPVEDVPAGLGASPVPRPEKPRRELDAADAIIALREEGVHDGIAAFGLPGSHPPKSGILVPEGFELPEGYVRHYQSTDDGEQLPAILMFHPDYEFRNERGEVVPVPEDLVVPPEMAPPGLATDEVLEVPERKAGEPVH